MAEPLALQRGVGSPTKCKSCKRTIIFAITYSTGKKAPFEEDPAGEWILENGTAKHIGPVSPQLELGAPQAPTRYTSHFAACPEADSWRKR